MTGPVRVEGPAFTLDAAPYRVCGVTYGPFAPDTEGAHFPLPERTARDFAQMRAVGINSIRTYYVPPAWLLSLAQEAGIHLLIDVPWSKHLCFLDSEAAQSEARSSVRAAVAAGRGYSAILGYSIGNEIPANIVRWHGAARVERFLGELADVAKQVDDQRLVTYANYPSTEYLRLPFLDFATFNVYLHDREIFGRYLLRLQNLTGDIPLVLGELGMDTLRHTGAEQAAFVGGHLREATLLGLAGAFVFAWTDDWFTGGHQIEDWAFGLTTVDRSPKEGLAAVASIYTRTPAALTAETPRVSIIVCTYNGGSTLRECIDSLLRLDYPDYEVIVVDDGSTDDTAEIVSAYPAVHSIHQTNQGLSAARNAGLRDAGGAVVAYTDSDCAVSPSWLTHLVHRLTETGAAGVGGPNLTPEDGWLAACVAASPGQPTHVLETDEIAEHIPGCNMAFRREALESVGGFDPIYRRAGDDVDICWRLQRAGMWITFAPGAFVWHHRRQTPRAYLRQQAGYGEAEALLWFAHPERFNFLGEGRWKGVLYGAGERTLQIGRPIIYRGVFGSAPFQTLYAPAAAHWLLYPAGLEWMAVIIGAGAVSTAAPELRWLPVGLLCASLISTAVRAFRAPLPSHRRLVSSRLVIAALTFLQPLVRSIARYRTRLFPPADVAGVDTSGGPGRPLPFRGRAERSYWDEAWRERTDLLDRVVTTISPGPWAILVDHGWEEWDITIFCHPWTLLRLATAQEDHGSGRRLVRVRYSLVPAQATRIAIFLSSAAVSSLTIFQTPIGLAAGSAALVCGLGVWRQGLVKAGRFISIVDREAKEMGLISCDAEDAGK